MSELTPNEQQFIDNATILVGIDEAGAGNMAGDLVVAGCILPHAHGIEGLSDSKKLSEKKRNALFELIKENALAYHIEHITPQEIDNSNIFACRMNGMRKCADALSHATHVIVDGNKVPHNMPKPTIAIVKGDDKVDCVRAASILAKVSKDMQLNRDGAAYPEFQFEKNKGYGTKVHMEALQRLGPTPLHRYSYKPVREAAERHANKDSSTMDLKGIAPKTPSNDDDDFSFRF